MKSNTGNYEAIDQCTKLRATTFAIANLEERSNIAITILKKITFWYVAKKKNILVAPILFSSTVLSKKIKLCVNKTWSKLTFIC